MKITNLLRERIQNTIFEHRISLLVDDSKNRWLRDLGKNDLAHSQNIESLICRIIPANLIKLDDYISNAEIFILLYAVYLHDFGRKLTPADGKNHEFISSKEIQDNWEIFKLNNKWEAKAVATICKAHAAEEKCPIDSIDPEFGIHNLSDRTLDLQFLSALLRMCDELDNLYTRVDGIIDESHSIRHLIRFVNFDFNHWTIILQTEPQSQEDWVTLNNIREKIEFKLLEINHVFERKEIFFNQVIISPSQFEDEDTAKGERVSKGIAEPIDAFEKPSREKIETKKDIQLLALGSGKGGVGKTNVALNLAISLGILGQRVLLVDADIGLGNIDVLLGLTPKLNIVHLLDGTHKLDDVLIPGPENIKILPAGSGIENLLHMGKSELNVMQLALSQIYEEYDYMIMDLSPGITSTVIDFYKTANTRIIVVTPEPTSITDAYALIKVMSVVYGINNFHIIVNNTIENEGDEVFRQLKLVSNRFLDVNLYHLGNIPHDELLVKAVRHQQPFVARSPESKASRAIAMIARAILRLPEIELDKAFADLFIRNIE